MNFTTPVAFPPDHYDRRLLGPVLIQLAKYTPIVGWTRLGSRDYPELLHTISNLILIVTVDQPRPSVCLYSKSYLSRMMTECAVCGDGTSLSFRCSYCEGIYCETHRLPEAHACDGVQFLSDPGKRFESKFTDEVVYEDEEISGPEPIDVEQTVGSTKSPEYESPPPVEVRTTEESAKASNPILTRLRAILDSLF